MANDSATLGQQKAASDAPSWEALRPTWRDAMPLTLGGSSEAYSVTHNPFAVASILPLLVVSTLLAYVGVLLNAPYVPVAGFLIIASLGLLLIPALGLRGQFILDDDRVGFTYGKKEVVGTWSNVTGLTFSKVNGLCLRMDGVNIKGGAIHGLGGLRAQGSTASVPLRFFGDRRFAILYAVRHHLPLDAYQPALVAAGEPNRGRCLFVYGLTALVCALAILAVSLLS